MLSHVETKMEETFQEYHFALKVNLGLTISYYTLSVKLLFDNALILDFPGGQVYEDSYFLMNSPRRHLSVFHYQVDKEENTLHTIITIHIKWRLTAKNREIPRI